MALKLVPNNNVRTVMCIVSYFSVSYKNTLPHTAEQDSSPAPRYSKEIADKGLSLIIYVLLSGHMFLVDIL